jgi:tRNA(Glu) U13 pseudouridine synthase TruD
MDALNLLANMSQFVILFTLIDIQSVRPKSFNFAGTKDRRAITVQRITGYRVQASKMMKLNKTLNGIKLGNFR